MSLKPGEIEIGARGLFIAGALFAAWSATLIALLQIDLTWAALLWVPLAVALRSFFKCRTIYYRPRCHARDALPYVELR